MAIFAQHGWGKSDKIHRGIADQSIGGVIMSPRDESPANLSAFLSTIPTTVTRLADPQLYAATIWPVRDGKLPSYDHYRGNLTPASFSVSAIRDFVEQSLSWQYGIDVSEILSPTVMVDDLNSQWSQIAMMLAQETVAQHNGASPLLISVVIGEDALRHRTMVDGWLNDITRFDVDGFYLVIRRAAESYRQLYEPDVLGGLLRVCYSLAELNQYEVVMGYTDMVTLLMHAVGVRATGAGWFAGLRQFNLRRFQPSTGGRRPRSRYSSALLLNSIYMTELDAIHGAGRIADVLSGSGYDNRFTGNANPENVAWPDEDAALHHWCVLDSISRSVAGPTISDRLDNARDLILQARLLYNSLQPVAVFTTETGPTHLDQWLESLNRFRQEASV